MTTVVVSTDRKPEIEGMIRRLPAMLAGRVPDERGIAAGFKSRVAWSFMSLVGPAFNAKGRGQQDSAGESWHELSPEYLAYQRPVVGRQKPRAGGLAPGGHDGYLTPDQLRIWRRTFADAYAWFVMRKPDREAKEIAGRIAWAKVKRLGAKTKISTFGQRKAGIDYQILVDRGILRQSLQPGELLREESVDAEYRAPRDQAYEVQQTQLVVGSTVPYASAHHNAKNPRRRRRLWPQNFPADWWRQILSVAQSGVTRIGELFGGPST